MGAIPLKTSAYGYSGSTQTDTEQIKFLIIVSHRHKRVHPASHISQTAAKLLST